MQRQNPGAHLKNEKPPAASQRYDRNAAIWPQMWLPVRQTSSNRDDANSAITKTPIKSVTIESCRRRGLDPYAYLRDVLTRLPHLTNHQIHEVTPEAWAKPQKQKAQPLAA